MEAATNHAPYSCANTLGLAARVNSAEKNPMNEELQQAVDAGKLTTQAAEALSRLEPGACCLHKSWGFGRVAEWSLLTGQIVIDFQSKKGHLMQAQYAAETLQPIPADHILARKIADPDAVKTQAWRILPHSFAKSFAITVAKATFDQIAAALGPEIFDSATLQEMVGPRQKETQGRRPFPASPPERTNPSFCSTRHRRPPRD